MSKIMICKITQLMLHCHENLNFDIFSFQSLLNALQCTEIKELPLSGHCVTSLADLVLYQNSQGGFAQYRLNQGHTNPLSKRASRKRKGNEMK